MATGQVGQAGPIMDTIPEVIMGAIMEATILGAMEATIQVYIHFLSYV